MASDRAGEIELSATLAWGKLFLVRGGCSFKLGVWMRAQPGL